MPIFLHADFIHLSSNIFSQLILGSMIEQQLGFVKFALLYMGSGVGGYVFSSIANDNLSVGASTAIFGLIGAMVNYSLLYFSIVRLYCDELERT